MNQPTYPSPAIQLSSGPLFHFFDHKPEDIQIGDIAHSLSQLCRFTGHTKDFYSVAQHSVLVSRNVPVKHRLVALLHDATEAYINDMAKPVKNMPALRGYEELEAMLWRSIADRFDLPYLLPACVKEADKRMLFTEKRDLMPPCEWGYAAEPYAEPIHAWSPMEAGATFLETFFDLTS